MAITDISPTEVHHEERESPPTDVHYEKTSRHMSTGSYITTRLTSLKPPMNKTGNPIKLLRSLDRKQWLFFTVAFCAWAWDAFDFFSVSLTVTELAETFGKSTTDITWGITLVLMFRSIGSTIFGIASDRYGRKWPFVINNLLFVILELGTGFCKTYKQFLAVRALFGIAMGGLYGNATSTALEDCPSDARGIISGILQQGYTFGYLFATACARGLVNTTSHGWRPLYWFGACPPILFIFFRLYLPETDTFIARQAIRHEEIGGGSAKVFIHEGKVALKNHWKILVYMVLLMAGFNFMAHGSQDLYPTMLKSQLEFSPNQVTVTQVVANLGAMVGGTVIGFCSQIFGRRLSIIVMCVLGGALLYPYTYVHSDSVIASAFFEQMCVQGAWGVIPVHLMEMSPGGLRTFVVGTAYQLGNLASSASSTIESRLAQEFPLPNAQGSKVARFNYGKVICIFLGAVYVFVIILTLLGPEYLGRNLDVEHDEDIAEVTFGAHGQLADNGEDEEKAAVVMKEVA